MQPIIVPMRLFLSCLLLLSVLVSAAHGALLCPRGFTLVNNRCIRVFSNNLKHREAETDCTYLGGTLVNIQNSIDNRAIAVRAANAGISNMWIGVFCFSSNATDCYYDDASGTASNYTNFAAGNPQVVGGSGGCVYMSTSTGQWLSARCDVVGMPFVCEVPYTVPDDCTHNYNGFCYFPSTELSITSVNMTHDRAQSICESKSMNLVSIHSKREHDYIRSVYRSIAASSNVSQIVLGAVASLPDTFDWDDMSDWDFDYMDPLAPRGKGNCLVMDLWGVGLWKEVNCQQPNYFMCKRTAGVTTTQETVQKVQKTPRSSPHVFQFDTDFSNCNSSLILAPGLITSPGYPTSGAPPGSCSYSLRTLGPYRLGVYFTDFHTNSNQVRVYDEYKNLIGSYAGDENPFSLLAPSNIVEVTFSMAPYNNVLHGFSATFLPVS